MSQRHRLTISDYAVMAICPSLIVLLLSSLVYFLILCVYQGGYPGRLGYIWFMFILGAVNIARLSIEQSRKYAFGYAAVLGLATFFVLGRLGVVSGPAAAFAPFVTAALIAIVWFLADRVTYDCTLIDDDEDPGDQGLLDGLTRPPGEAFEPQVVAADTADTAATADRKPVDPASSDAVKKIARRSRRRRTRQPGRTVLWLTAAALPMFGLGQATLHGQPDAVAASVRALAVYLFAALSLLVATSFLGVRSYLRRRGVAMPRDVSVAWLGGGIALVALLLSVSFLLPQPGRILADLQVPKWLESPEGLGPSRFGWGSETAESDGQSDSTKRPATTANQESADARDGDSGTSPEGQPSQNRSSSDQPNGQPGGQQDDPQGNQTGDQQGGRSNDQAGDRQGERPGDEQGAQQGGDRRDRQAPQPEGQESDQQQTAQPEGQQDRPPGEPQGTSDRPADQPANRTEEGSDRPERPQPSAEADTPKQSPETQEPSSDRSDSSAESPPDAATPPPDASSPRSPSFDPSSVLWLLKALIYLVLLLVLAAFVWVNRATIVELWQRLQAWLAGKPASSQSAEPIAAILEPSRPAKPFSAFTNPLATGVDPRRAVIETFQATEAWYREQGQPRGRDETPQEYVRRLQTATAADRQLMEQLTAAYNRIVYGGQSASRRDLHQVRLVWESVFRSR
ncbi:MAG: DUF4129 domain-containing protein [Planctomycetaceae bacterium]|nr:MAG: DUF4129 domain-containing protein [Planctomycetaceae bacterium]